MGCENFHFITKPKLKSFVSHSGVELPTAGCEVWQEPSRIVPHISRKLMILNLFSGEKANDGVSISYVTFFYL